MEGLFSICRGSINSTADFKTSHSQELNVPTWHTFTFLGCWPLLVILLHATSSSLHLFPAAEHVIILICGDLLWTLILRKVAWEEIQEETVRQDEVKDHEQLFCSQKYQKEGEILSSYLHSGHAVCHSTRDETLREEENKFISLDSRSFIVQDEYHRRQDLSHDSKYNKINRFLWVQRFFIKGENQHSSRGLNSLPYHCAYWMMTGWWAAQLHKLKGTLSWVLWSFLYNLFGSFEISDNFWLYKCYLHKTFM